MSSFVISLRSISILNQAHFRSTYLRGIMSDEFDASTVNRVVKEFLLCELFCEQMIFYLYDKRFSCSALSCGL